MLQLNVGSVDQASDSQIEFIDGFGDGRIRARLKACSASFANNVFPEQLDGNLQWLATRRATPRKPNRIRHDVIELRFHE